MEKPKGLSYKAYELQTGEEYEPYVSDEVVTSEFTFKATFLGVILTIIFGMAMAYTGLKIGMTVSTSIPAAVISMGILRGFFKKATILENNIVQTIASAGSSLASGVIFTIPALYIWGMKPDIFQITLISILGGTLGVLFMIPLRKYLIVQEHGKLKYPEGTACAEVLVAGEIGGSHAKMVFSGILVSAFYKLANTFFKFWNGVVEWQIKGIKNLVFSADFSPILLGVGYIVGLRISALMLAGGLLAWWVFIPLITYLGANLPAALLPVTNKLISQMAPIEIWKNYVRYIGAGAVAFGGMISLMKSMPTIVNSFVLALKEIIHGFKGVNQEKKRTNSDIHMSWVLLGSVILTIVLAVLPKGYFPAGWTGAILVLVFGFLFVTVSSRIVGIVGSSSNPVSGMTIGTLIATCFVLKSAGFIGKEGMLAALMVGAVVCIAMCIGGDTSQDLKTGYLVGGTPKWQQITMLIGTISSAVFVGWTITLLHKTIGIGTQALPAPQATLMSILIPGIMQGNLPWILIFIGAVISIIVELLGTPALPFAVGLYLPLELSTPIIAGGIINWLITYFYKGEIMKKKIEKGMLICSGLISGEAIMGIILAVLLSQGIGKASDAQALISGNFVPLIAFLLLSLYLWFYIKKNESIDE